ncbi:vacuolar protein sorting-associated protein 9A-like isoform X2 [Oryza brachyantha]|uniref:vacuolar protein sorting-associated protein 9A-like isoform X2 n=1 Tax=Oryza brachyantha TaxID=4533 RepID=UPI001ADACD68|nr:vacuolar protein sorting-associated protein 9A-like isoform X2 [Oryza brachyantha]
MLLSPNSLPSPSKIPAVRRARARPAANPAMESPASPASRLDFYDFIARMRRPAAAGLFHSIRNFLASLSQGEPNAEEGGARVQAFFAEMEAAIRDHPLWANASNQEIDNALEGLEKFIMTKLFDRTFASSAEDVKADMEITEKIGLLQRFVRPHHLDIPKVLHNETAWLLAVKELQKINSFKSPREKLICVLSCCQIINNLLLNVSMSNDRTLSGADDFLPILIYITIKANPPQLHSNLKFIQLFRRETKLISEVEYYLTNLISAKMFIINVDGRSLSMEESVFQAHMESARLGNHISVASSTSSQGLGTSTAGLNEESGVTEGACLPVCRCAAGRGGIMRLMHDSLMKLPAQVLYRTAS